MGETEVLCAFLRGGRGSIAASRTVFAAATVDFKGTVRRCLSIVFHPLHLRQQFKGKKGRIVMNVRTFMIQILILTLVHSGLLDGESKPHVGDSQFPLRQRIEQFGVGTELKVKLADGTKLRGLVERIGEESFFGSAQEFGNRPESCGFPS
jgi:hypothetical protein